jgi:hypothetical protein
MIEDLGFKIEVDYQTAAEKAPQLRSQSLRLLTYPTAYAPGSSLPAASLDGFLISLQGSTYQPITRIEKLAMEDYTKPVPTIGLSGPSG